MFVGFSDKELSLYSRPCEKYIWAMGREEGVDKIMPYAILLFDLLSKIYFLCFTSKEKVSFTSKGVSNGYNMCEKLFQRAVKVGGTLNVVKSMEERQGKIFYYFGVIYFYCFFSFC